MIRLPRRSITRFFLPFIDVLILLLCIFLLLPYAKPGDTDKAEKPAPEPSTAEVRADLAKIEAAELARQLAAAREELRHASAETVSRLSVAVLTISPENGRLFHRGGPATLELTGPREAEQFIDRQNREAARDNRKAYFLILMPPANSPYPEERQLQAYRRWFDSVPHGFDDPGRQR